MTILNMRVVVTRYGGPDVLRVVHEPLRPPEADEVRIRVQCAGVALADVMRREGVYPSSPTPPFTPGYDVVGTVDEVGAGVLQFSRGDRVAAFFHGVGGYASHVFANAHELVAVPLQLDAAEAVATVLNYVTAYQMLHRVARVRSGQSVLIHGASGGVGTALLDLGRLLHLRMFGTASSVKHPTVARFGALPIDYRSEDFVDVLHREAPDGIDAVFDPIGGPNWRRSLQTLGRDGQFVGYGYTSVLEGQDPGDWATDWGAFGSMGATERGNPVHMYSITALKKDRPDWFQEDLRLLFSLLEQERIQPIVSQRIPLRDAARAHASLERSLSVGKIVLTA